MSFVFRIKNESNPLADGRFSSFPDAINKSVLPSKSLIVQLVATFLCISLNMVSASGLLFVLHSLIIVSTTICSNLFIFSTIFSQKIRQTVAATELFLFCNVLMKVICTLSDKFRLKFAKLSKVLSS